jgi:hypothetical protein
MDNITTNINGHNVELKFDRFYHDDYDNLFCVDFYVEGSLRRLDDGTIDRASQVAMIRWGVKTLRTVKAQTGNSFITAPFRKDGFGDRRKAFFQTVGFVPAESGKYLYYK